MIQSEVSRVVENSIAAISEQHGHTPGRPPRWAIEREKAIRDEGFARGDMTITLAFARYIADHEEAPVDPVILAARQLFIEDNPAVAADGIFYKDGAGNRLIRAGQFDGRIEIVRYAKAIRRGMEIARATGTAADVALVAEEGA